MGLKSEMVSREIDKVITQACNLKTRTENYLKTTDDFSNYNEVDFASALIVKEILAKPESVAFTAWRMLEDAETQYEELMEERQYREISESQINFAFNMRKQALEIIRKEITKDLETHIGQKIVRLSNSQMDSLLNKCDEVREKAFGLLIKNGFSSRYIETLVNHMLTAKDSFRPDCTEKALTTETRCFNNIVESISEQEDINFSSNPTIANQYAGLIEHIAIIDDSIPLIVDKSEDLKSNAQKKVFTARYYNNDTKTARADYYFSLFKECLYGEDLKLNKENRSKYFGDANRIFGVSEMKSLAQSMNPTKKDTGLSK